MTKKIIFIGAMAMALFSFRAAHAATMSFVSSESHASIGDTIDVSVRVDSAGQAINAAQGTIQYPANILQAVRVDHSNSIFNIWAEEPTINASTGEIVFLGGGTNSFSGTSLYILDITFLVKGTGLATLNFANAGVTAGDGTGANILSATSPTSINVGGAGNASSTVVTVTQATVPGFPDTGTAALVAPESVTRTPVAAVGLPAMPVVQVPLYPDPTHWYNVLGDTIALWNVPPDVTAVATGLAHTESDASLVTEKTLSNGQDFGTLKDGIWYIAVRFKNNIGWGLPAYYKISVDTAVPLPFTTQIENAGTDNPSPMIQFATSDSLSGITGYTVIVDGTVIATTTANATTMTLPPQAPGAHTLVVTASDLAGNSALDSTSFQILPLPTPQITFVGTSVSGGNFAFASGISAPSSSVEVVVVDASKREVFDGMTPVEGDGHWNITVNVPLAPGRYSLSATAHNTQGAESVASAFQGFTVNAPSVISFGIIQLGWFEILIIVLLLIVAAVSLWSRQYVLKNQKRGLYNTVAARDIEKLSDMLSANIKSLGELPSVKNAMSDPELGYHLGKMNENVAKLKKYIKQELEQLK